MFNVTASPIEARTSWGAAGLSAVAFLVGACSTPPMREEAQPTDVMMLLQNYSGPFATKQVAEKIAIVLVGEKYAYLLEPAPPASTTDDGDNWVVSVPVHVATGAALDSRIAPRAITFVIRKRDAAVLGIR